MTWRSELLAEIPQWAQEAVGFPAPTENESFDDYCIRLGFPQDVIDDHFVDLTEQTACLANLRLRETLHKHLPAAFERYVYGLKARNLTYERRQELKWIQI